MIGYGNEGETQSPLPNSPYTIPLHHQYLRTLGVNSGYSSVRIVTVFSVKW